MSEDDKNKQPQDQKREDTVIHVQVDSEQMKAMLIQLEEEKAKAKKLQEDMDKALADKKVSEEALEKTKTESDDYKSKLEIIAQKEFDKRKAALLEKAKTAIKDEGRLKQIETDLTDPDKLKASEFMIDTLIETLKKGEEETRIAEEERKKAENKGTNAPAGTVLLTPAQTGQSVDGEGEGYDTYVAMVQDLRRKERFGTPEEQAEAKITLDELFKKWCGAVKRKYDGVKGLEHTEEKQKSVREMTKQGGAA